MFRSVWRFLWIITTSVSLASVCSAQVEFYEKGSSLQQTMLSDSRTAPTLAGRSGGVAQRREDRALVLGRARER